MDCPLLPQVPVHIDKDKLRQYEHSWGILDVYLCFWEIFHWKSRWTLCMLIFRLRLIVIKLNVSDWCSLKNKIPPVFSALQKNVCSQMEACFCTQFYRSKWKWEIFLLFTIYRNIFLIRHIKQSQRVLVLNQFTDCTARTTEVYVRFLQKFVQQLS